MTKADFPYLDDSTFLKAFDENRLKEQYAKITVMTWDEKPLQSIEGKVTGGTVNLDGNSILRRTCSLSLIADEYHNDLSSVDHILSLNKKVTVMVGFVNNTKYYTEYDMIWFPLGVYIIYSSSITHSMTGTTISLQLKDKMCLLNGDCGGVIPASTTFSDYDTVDESGKYVTVYPTLYQIIQEAVNHFGGEQLGKIIISDIDTRIKKVMKWTGSNPLYIIEYTSGGNVQYQITTDSSNVADLTEGSDYTTYTYGDDVGYIYTDFVYTDDLTVDAGGAVTDVLDKIITYLGNYEYFYDIWGNFIFQEKKNYLNTSQSTVILENLSNDDYLIDLSKGKAVYVFDDSNLITSYTNNPQYNMIKNDFIVWGQRESADGLTYDIRYHLAIDEKPQTGNYYDVFFYEDDDGITKAKCPFHFDTYEDFPEQGVEESFYMDDSGEYTVTLVDDDGEIVYETTTDEDGNETYVTDDDGEKIPITYTAYIYKWSSSDVDYVPINVELQTIQATDWRTELYLSGACASPLGTDSNYYYTELNNEWPKLYDMQNGKFYDEVSASPWDIDFFLDFVDSGAEISEFSVSNIGRRTKVVVDDDVNCVFEPSIPDIVLIEAGQDDTSARVAECEEAGQIYCQIEENLFDMLAGGGSANSAYEYVRDLLYQYTSYNETISLSAIPIFYLEPNTRITVRDPRSGIYGDYLMNTISIPLDISGSMSISCTRALERI